MPSMTMLSRKLIKGINYHPNKKEDITFSYSYKEVMYKDKTIHNFSTISIMHYDADKQKYVTTPIYSTPSLLRIVLYLRDYLFILDNKELPTDQEKWNEIRERLITEGNYIYGKYRSQYSQ